MTRISVPLVLLIALSVPAAVLGQSKIAVVDFERAVVECAEGQVSQQKFNARFEEKQKEIEKRRKELEAIQIRLQTQDKVLSDTVKLGLQRDLERGQVEFTRISEDAQKELEALRNDLLQPIAQKASAVLNSFAVEQGYSLVVDTSNPENNVVFVNPNNDITEELIRRLDAAAAAMAKPAERPAEPAQAPAATQKP
jgi:outer membrane protein